MGVLVSRVSCVSGLPNMRGHIFDIRGGRTNRQDQRLMFAICHDIFGEVGTYEGGVVDIAFCRIRRGSRVMKWVPNIYRRRQMIYQSGPTPAKWLFLGTPGHLPEIIPLSRVTLTYWRLRLVGTVIPVLGEEGRRGSLPHPVSFICLLASDLVEYT